jgi:hypothetical protein
MSGQCDHEGFGIHLHGTMTVCNECGAPTGVASVIFEPFEFADGTQLEVVRCGAGWDVRLTDARQTYSAWHGRTQPEAFELLALEMTGE